ncbi:hypothetical protein [Kutzneria buriramensis]|uniref:Uncharacterized protein n=1 Tax=Kutzneria buriramensis TaxID=1045776 RepID=A0A3E0HEL6_9PSEU|nr:hypothetical protein [Kutzneria buriramensis]REH43648.1 hypothetical protein BCF44_109191 [Kutzneria buriramensis]
MEPWRIYRLCRMFGRFPRPGSLDDQPAGLNDWLLAIDDIYRELDARRERARYPA